MKYKTAGFTLIELMVVLSILGILAGIAIPRVTGIRDKAVYLTGELAMSRIKNFTFMYFVEYGENEGVTLNTVVKEYTEMSGIDQLFSEGWELSSPEDGDEEIAEDEEIVITNNNYSDLKDLQLDLENGEVTRVE